MCVCVRVRACVCVCVLGEGGGGWGVLTDYTLCLLEFNYPQTRKLLMSREVKNYKSFYLKI